MTGLSGVTTEHIRLFGISVIDVFFMLPLGLKQYAVQGLCMLMCPLTPAVSNYPWGMEPRLGLQPPAIIWVMAKLHKSFCRKLEVWGEEWERNHSGGARSKKMKDRWKQKENKKVWRRQGFNFFLPPVFFHSLLMSPLWTTSVCLRLRGLSSSAAFLRSDLITPSEINKRVRWSRNVTPHILSRLCSGS